ncbi:sortase-associated OmpA-like protein PdsO [Colwellia demingiae]|uniref:Sortase-associated OmpA-like protein PdsO n=1 Tax=Colwellia demingiae TaxID=89401 RepID=A0A5C6Q525_9GAMM|nr:sortase-associated OmpA-like protein PdsO [Colwellia demingiae]TWX63922.1 sortase-associated OmpA-like protein PdsO [Colwellia demingiae]
MKNTNQLAQAQPYKITGKKLIVTTALIAALATSSVNATENTLAPEKIHQEATNDENIGFGTGAVIGAIVAGPLGAIVAGIGGVFVAKYINVNDQNDELSTALVNEQRKQRSNEQIQSQYQAKLQRLEASYQQQLVALETQQDNSGQLQADNLLMSLQFSTGSSDIAPHYQEQVAALAQILNSSPEMKIDLSGYTDLIGEQSLNQTLSQARVESVRTLLMAQGVEEQQIATFAFGEESPVVANNESEVSFYDRRVVLKLHTPPSKEESQTINNQMANNQ